jgi:hypothetical protein
MVEPLKKIEPNIARWCAHGDAAAAALLTEEASCAASWVSASGFCTIWREAQCCTCMSSWRNRGAAPTCPARGPGQQQQPAGVPRAQ